jgi:hypothetical protein
LGQIEETSFVGRVRRCTSQCFNRCRSCETGRVRVQGRYSRNHLPCCSTDPVARKHARSQDIVIGGAPPSLSGQTQGKSSTVNCRARYPSGKGEVCKTFTREFDSRPRLQPSSTLVQAEIPRAARDFACELPLRSRPQNGSSSILTRASNLSLAAIWSVLRVPRILLSSGEREIFALTH